MGFFGSMAAIIDFVCNAREQPSEAAVIRERGECLIDLMGLSDAMDANEIFDGRL